MLFSEDFSSWEQTFQELIREEVPGAKWTLHLDKNIVPDGLTLGWRQYQQTVLGRFQCSRCYRSWTSAQVKILCHVYQDTSTSQGRVLMRIFGQKCQKCFGSQFENPEFSAECIKRILNNLVSYILQKCYGHRKIASISNASLDEKVLLDGPHDTLNCEACSLNPHGRCARAHRVRPPRSPSPSPSSHSSSPPKSRPPSSQTGNMDLGNRTFQDLREPREIGLPLLLILGTAALALISHFIR
ncbi:receptor-transporting protein 4 [Apodemus sylvaticus]|uniref:receptor-transporting protein 4 n=1 Tax=Apodemus sylvaticus TaxID=10129 RepID=UPI00224434E1|nr:receptor-transporting protein 4 [Apodemus sylvaticus]